MWLSIANHGEASPESFVILGASASRDDESSIGQFGSGAKHAVLTLLRNNIRFRVFCGLKEITFDTVDIGINGKQHKLLTYSVDGGEPHKTSYVLDFGAIDWTEPKYGLREIVANALDACGGDSDKVTVAICSGDPQKHEGETRVYVEFTPAVAAFFAELPTTFLQFDPARKQYVRNCVPFPKAKGDLEQPHGLVYCRGVLIGTTGRNSGFNYSVPPNSVRLDESRNAHPDSLTKACAAVMGECADVATYRKFLRCTVKRNCSRYAADRTFEQDYLGYHLFSKLDLTGSYKAFLQAWKEEYNGAYVAFGAQISLIKKATEQGIPFVVVHDDDYTWLTIHAGVQSLIKCEQLQASSHGHVAIPVTVDCLAACNVVWKHIELLGMTSGKSMPAVHMFSEPGGSLRGYYVQNQNAVWLEEEQACNIPTILEEFAHHVSGANDETREFQEWLLRFAVKSAGLM